MNPAIALAAILASPASVEILPDQEARSALGTCFAAIIDEAPVADVRGQHVEIRRATDPNPAPCGSTPATRPRSARWWSR